MGPETEDMKDHKFVILRKEDSITKEFHYNLAETVILVHIGIFFHWTKLKAFSGGGVGIIIYTVFLDDAGSLNCYL